MIELYLTFSILIGLIIILDAVLLLKENGQYGTNKVISVTTFIEFTWAIFSVYVLFKYTCSELSMLVPIVYVTYNILGWLYGLYLVSKIDGGLEGVTQFFIPIWYVKFSLTFGVVFSCFSFIMLFRVSS